MSRSFFNFFARDACILLLMALGTASGVAVEGTRNYAIGALPAAAGAGAQDNSNHRQDIPPPSANPPGPLSRKQKKDLLKSNIEKMKRDAEELAALTKSLQGDIAASNENVMSLKIVETAEKIEKLARKIKITARGN